MRPMQSPECVDCPLLDKTIENGCPGDLHEPVIPGKTSMIFPQGEHIFKEGTPIEGIHCMHSGQVALAKQRGNEEKMITAVATPGDVLGMPDILGEEAHRNDALALQDTCTCFIPKEEALTLMMKHPAIMIRIMRKMCERIRSMEQHIEKGGGEHLP